MRMNQIKVELQSTFGTDRDVANAAWTSSYEHQKKKQRTDEDVKRVINLLADQKHSVPFEGIIFRFWIKMSIATDRQFMTHRLQSASGMSGRYRTMPNEYLDLPEDVENILDKFKIEAGLSTNPTTINAFQEYYKLCESANNMYSIVSRAAKEAEKNQIISNSEYKRLREFYRGVLPQHNMTERVTVINLRSFANFIKLRLSEHAQPEIREVARQMLEQVKQNQDIKYAIEALERNNWVI